MVKVYCYSKCTTCKRALKWLTDNGIEHTVIDIKEEHPDEKALHKYHKMSGLPLRKLFNTSGQLYREMGLSKNVEASGIRRNVSEEAASGYRR